MAQSYEEIYGSLNNVYDPQRGLINEQMAQLPGQYQAGEQGLGYAKQNAFDDIIASANRRGVAAGGIPLTEQNRYVGEKYLPQLAALKSQQQEAQNQFRAQLIGVGQTQSQNAYGIREKQLDRDAQAAEAERTRQAAAAASAQQGAAIRALLEGNNPGANGAKPAGNVTNGMDPHVASVFEYIKALRSKNPKMDWSQLAQQLAKPAAQGGLGENIASGSAADKALRAYFIGEETAYNGPKAIGVNPGRAAANVGVGLLANSIPGGNLAYGAYNLGSQLMGANWGNLGKQAGNTYNALKNFNGNVYY